MVKTIEDSFRDWESHVFGFGYGTGEKPVLDAVAKFIDAVQDDGVYDHRELERRAGSTVAWLLINVFCHNGLIEYGTSPRFGWLTEQGMALRDYFRNHRENLLYPLEANSEDYTPCYPDICNCGPHGYSKTKLCHNPFWPERKPAKRGRDVMSRPDRDEKSLEAAMKAFALTAHGVTPEQYDKLRNSADPGLLVKSQNAMRAALEAAASTEEK